MYQITNEHLTDIVSFNGYHIATITNDAIKTDAIVTLHFKNNETERFGTFTEAMEFMDVHFRALMKIIEGVLTNRFILIYMGFNDSMTFAQSNSFQPDYENIRGLIVIDVYTSKAFRNGKWEDIA